MACSSGPEAYATSSFGTVWKDAPPSVVKSVIDTVAVQLPENTPRSSVTVTGPIVPAVRVLPMVTVGSIAVSGALIERPVPAFGVTVTVTRLAEVAPDGSRTV
ncbi:hypothetical protein ACI2K4_07845 [Micromonospora sp. NPDC050397]|uniref:hypothetical protein n=1 Tax=Micromonospora sp. NPDC050397 TaxID=3364279 RepID=UPI003850AC57